MGLRLLGSATSPYVRVVRMQLVQCGLTDRVSYEVVPTRVVESPLHAFNPTGKVPTLVLDDGPALSEARLICDYLDGLHDGAPFVHPVDRVEDRALEGFLVGCLDGTAVRIRERRRPEEDQSADILAQEERRAARCLTWLEANLARLRPASDYAMCCLAVTLGRLEHSLPEDDWQVRYPGVAGWYAQAMELPAVRETRPGAA